MLVVPVRLTADIGCRRTTEARALMRVPARLVLYVSFPSSEPRDATMEEPNRPSIVAARGR